MRLALVFIMADGAENALFAEAVVGGTAVGVVGVGVFDAAPGVSERNAGDREAGVVVF